MIVWQTCSRISSTILRNCCLSSCSSFSMLWAHLFTNISCDTKDLTHIHRSSSLGTTLDEWSNNPIALMTIIPSILSSDDCLISIWMLATFFLEENSLNLNEYSAKILRNFSQHECRAELFIGMSGKNANFYLLTHKWSI